MSKEKNALAYRVFKRVLIVLLCIGVAGVMVLFGINDYVKGSVSERLLSPQQAVQLQNVDCIVVLGCQVKADGTPSDMLRDRLTRGVALYTAGVAPKLLMSGDHGQQDYNEVSTMKQFAVDAGVPSADVFMDHAGFSTYESIYRAKEIFQADKVIIVTQKYHLYRALYIAENLGVEAYGVDCDYRSYAGQSARDIREVLARFKDFIISITKPEPTYLGETIPVNGNGDIT